MAMKYVLGRAVFDIHDGFRDDSTYIFQSPDERDLVQVTPMPDAADANDIPRLLRGTARSPRT
jgi:hypothetical protein